MKVWKIVFIIWVTIWLLFLVRGFAKGEFEKFKTLCFADRVAKLDYILGRELNVFLETCLKEMPTDTTFAFKSDLEEHDRFRLIYYLYPRLESENPEYVLNIYTGTGHYEMRKLK